MILFSILFYFLLGSTMLFFIFAFFSRRILVNNRYWKLNSPFFAYPTFSHFSKIPTMGYFSFVRGFVFYIFYCLLTEFFRQSGFFYFPKIDQVYILSFVSKFEESSEFFNTLFLLDPASLFLQMLTSFILFMVISYSNVMKAMFRSNFEFTALFVLLFYFIYSLPTCFDFTSLYILVEGVTLALILLLLTFYNTLYLNKSLYTSYNVSTILESGSKYFCLSGLASIFFLLGICFIYALTGETNFAMVYYFFNQSEIFYNQYFLYLGFIFFSSSFFFKLSLFPCYFWTPDVYEGLNYSLLLIFAVAMKIVIFFLYLKILFFIFYNLLGLFVNSLYFFCFASIVLGAFKAITQVKIKRFLAFSSINQMGFMLLATLPGNYLNIQSSFFAIILYSLTVILFISVIKTVYIPVTYDVNLNFYKGINNSTSFLPGYNTLSLSQGDLPKSDNAGVLANTYFNKGLPVKMSNATHRPMIYLNDFVYLWKISPLKSLLLIVLLSSWAGIPPFAGFFGKFIIFTLLFNSSFSLFTAIILVFNLLSAYYYLRIIKIILFDTAPVQTVSSDENAFQFTYGLLIFVFSFFILNIESVWSLAGLLTHHLLFFC